MNLEKNLKDKKKSKSLFKQLEFLLSRQYIAENLPLKYIYNILFLFSLSIIYIANSHYHYKLLRKYNKLKNELEEQKIIYKTLHASILYCTRRSEILKKIESTNLKELSKPPMLIK